VHPWGDELVLCVEPGVWHTADVAGPATALFITAGLGTELRPPEIVHHAVRQIGVTYLSQRLPVGNVVLHHLQHGVLRQAVEGGVP
jgi:hypothetical protein